MRRRATEAERRSSKSNALDARKLASYSSYSCANRFVTPGSRLRFGREAIRARSIRWPGRPTQWSTADFAAEMRPLARPGSTFFLSSWKRSTRILRSSALVSASSKMAKSFPRP